MILQTSTDEFRSVAWTKYAAKYGIDTIILVVDGTDGQEVDLDNEFGLIKGSGTIFISLHITHRLYEIFSGTMVNLFVPKKCSPSR